MPSAVARLLWSLSPTPTCTLPFSACCCYGHRVAASGDRHVSPCPPVLSLKHLASPFSNPVAGKGNGCEQGPRSGWPGCVGGVQWWAGGSLERGVDSRRRGAWRQEGHGAPHGAHCRSAASAEMCAGDGATASPPAPRLRTARGWLLVSPDSGREQPEGPFGSPVTGRGRRAATVAAIISAWARSGTLPPLWEENDDDVGSQRALARGSRVSVAGSPGESVCSLSLTRPIISESRCVLT